MIALAEPLSAAEADALEEFRFQEGLGYALPRAHVPLRWTWAEAQRYLGEREERAMRRMELKRDEHIREVLEAVRRGTKTPAHAIAILEKLWREPEPIGPSIHVLFPEGRDRNGEDE